MTTKFVAEFKSAGADPVIKSFEAETVQLAVREVERALAAGVADEGVLYAPVRKLKAARVVSVQDTNGRQLQELHS